VPARIGELVAIPMLMRCVAPNIWGWLGDYTGRRLAIVRFGAVCTLLTFSLILVSKTYAWLAMVMALARVFLARGVAAVRSDHSGAFARARPRATARFACGAPSGSSSPWSPSGVCSNGSDLDIYPAALVLIMAGIVAQQPVGAQCPAGAGRVA
jgi:PPP family 3-phenylpropionic acid transporter